MATRVECANCQRELDEPRDTPLEERTPCPACGGTSRAFFTSAALTLGLRVSAEARAIAPPAPAREQTARLEETGFSVTWHRSPDGLLLVQVHDEKGQLLVIGGGDDVQDAILEVAEHLLPPDAA